MPTISICLPVYNGASHLGPAIESALSQTFSDFELLIADDLSSDNSQEIIQEFAKQDSRIIFWKNNENHGLFGNYNQCLAKASGKYVKPFAQDDLLGPTNLERMLDAFESRNNSNAELSLVACARTLIDDQGHQIKVMRNYDETSLIDGAIKVKEDLLKTVNGIGEPTTVMFPRDLAKDGFDTIFFQLGDIEYWHRIILTGKFLYLAEPLCSFRQHAQSTSNRNTQSMRYALDILYWGKKYEDFLVKQGISQEHFAQIALENISGHMLYLADRGEMTVDNLISKVNGKKKADELAGFKELAYRALIMAAQGREQMMALKCEREQERNHLENLLAGLINSRWWKMVTPLRRTAKALLKAPQKLNLTNFF